jgi:hypothetical protein
MKDSEVVEKALEILAEKGWCKGMPIDNVTGSVCVGEALYEAITNRNDNPSWKLDMFPSEADAKRFSLLGFAVSPGHENIAIWNDNEDTTFDSVRDHLITVAKEYRNEGR